MQNKLTNVTLTMNQKQLLVRIMSAPTPMLAGKEVRNGHQSMEAAKILLDLGLITYSNEEATITNIGTSKMKDENITDDAGQLTPYGNELKSQSSTGAKTAPPPAPQPSSDEQSPTSDGGPDSTWESFNLLRNLNDRIILG